MATVILPLSQGKVTLVDDVDLWVTAFKWHAILSVRGTWYASGRIDGKTVSLHRAIMNPAPGLVVDHASGDTLDNRRANLRSCTRSQNAMNRRILKSSKSSRFLGVYLNKGYWKATIGAGPIGEDGRASKVYLGIFPTEELAARAYDEAARHYFGEFASPNFK